MTLDCSCEGKPFSYTNSQARHHYSKMGGVGSKNEGGSKYEEGVGVSVLLDQGSLQLLGKMISGSQNIRICISWGLRVSSLATFSLLKRDRVSLLVLSSQIDLLVQISLL